MEYLVNNSHFLGSFVTSSSFPYASKDRREANEIVIISDSIDAVKVITTLHKKGPTAWSGLLKIAKHQNQGIVAVALNP